MDRETLETRMNAHDSFVPHHIRHGILNYVFDGVPAGGFVTAMFANDLIEAVGRADHINEGHIVGIARWITWYAPRSCWGGYDIVKGWQGLNKYNIKREK